MPHVSEITCYLSFSESFISLSIIMSRSIHAVARFPSFLILYNTSYLLEVNKSIVILSLHFNFWVDRLCPFLRNFRIIKETEKKTLSISKDMLAVPNVTHETSRSPNCLLLSFTITQWCLHSHSLLPEMASCKWVTFKENFKNKIILW